MTASTTDFETPTLNNHHKIKPSSGETWMQRSEKERKSEIFGRVRLESEKEHGER